MTIVKDVVHRDGSWHTSEYFYKERRVLIKSKKGHGIKTHIFFTDKNKVEFTRHYNFISSSKLLELVHRHIDGLKNKE